MSVDLLSGVIHRLSTVVEWNSLTAALETFQNLDRIWAMCVTAVKIIVCQITHYTYGAQHEKLHAEQILT